MPYSSPRSLDGTYDYTHDYLGPSERQKFDEELVRVDVSVGSIAVVLMCIPLSVAAIALHLSWALWWYPVVLCAVVTLMTSFCRSEIRSIVRSGA
jgi:uncharacterized membrane protein